MRSPVYLAIKKCSETRKSRSIYGAAIQIRTGVHVPRSRLRGNPERPRIEMRFAQGMRSPVLPTVKENLQNPKALKVSGAAIQIRTGVHVPRSRLRGSPERPRIRMRFAQGDEVSSLSCNNKEMLRNPKVSKHLWSCYPDSNWSPRPAEQAPREPGTTSDQNALRAGDEVSSFAYGKRKPSKPEGFEGFWSCYPDSNWRPHPYQGCALPAEL